MEEISLKDDGFTVEFSFIRTLIYMSVFFLALCFYHFFYDSYDLRTHIEFAEQLGQGQIVVPHFLYHLTIHLISNILHLPLRVASCLVLASCITSSMFIIEQIVGHFLRGKYSGYFLLLISLTLMIVTSCFFPLVNKSPYLGIWSPNPWHNPTFIAAKPFMLLSFYLYVLELAKEKCFEKRFSLIRLSILLAICTLIKPSYILAFIPCSIIICFFQSGKRTAMLVKTGLLLLPVLAVLVFQFLFTYHYNTSGSSSIQLCFLDVWQYRCNSVPLAILQATAFPLVILALQFRQLSKDKALFVSWIFFVIGLFIFGLLCESGERKYHGNFAWTYISCLNILFVFSTISFLRWASDFSKNTKSFQFKLFLCNSIFIFHLLSGMYYIAYLLSGNQF